MLEDLLCGKNDNGRGNRARRIACSDADADLPYVKCEDSH